MWSIIPLNWTVPLTDEIYGRGFKWVTEVQYKSLRATGYARAFIVTSSPKTPQYIFTRDIVYIRVYYPVGAINLWTEIFVGDVHLNS